MPWFFAVAERWHDIQNPTSQEKIRLLGEYLGIGAESRVLDIACGRGGPALVLIEEFGCSVVGVEWSPAFQAAALERARERGLVDRFECHLGDAADFPIEREAYDAALCLGATFVYGGLAETLRALVPAVRPGGHVAVGEPYWLEPPPPGEDDGYVSLAETVERFRAVGVPLVALVASSEDDWDRYESLHWQSLERWLAENPKDADAAEIRAEHEAARQRYVAFQRAALGWAIFVGWKRG